MSYYAAFAVLGVAFYQFGVGIAIERASAWEIYVRTLPVGAAARLAGRSLSALVFGVAAAAIVIATALASTNARPPPAGWPLLVATLLAGSVTFALLGTALGYWASPKGALPIANLLYLVLAYGGGLWTGPGNLPDPVEAESPALPTRAWGDLLWSSVQIGRGQVCNPVTL